MIYEIWSDIHFFFLHVEQVINMTCLSVYLESPLCTSQFSGDALMEEIITLVELNLSGEAMELQFFL